MFECRRIDQLDGGCLLATGVAWSESNPWVEGLGGLRDALAIMAGSFAVIVGIVVSIADKPAWIGLTAAGIGLMLYAHVSARPDFGRRSRALVFHRNGRAQVPHGLARYETWREMSRPHTEIVSIEARQIVTGEASKQTAYCYGIALYRRSGDIVYIARRLDEFEAHKVAVQLSLALADIRHEIGNGSGTQRSRAHRSRGAMRGEAIII